MSNREVVPSCEERGTPSVEEGIPPTHGIITSMNLSKINNN